MAKDKILNIITSLFGGVAMGCLCSSVEKENLPIVIATGICGAVCIFSYMKSGSKKTQEQLDIISNSLLPSIKEEIANQMQSSQKKQDELINRINNLSDGKLTELNKCLNSISNNWNQQLDKIINALLPSIKEEIASQMQSSQKKQDELINRINNLSDGKLTAVNEYLSGISNKQTKQLELTSIPLSNISNALLPSIKEEITNQMQSSQKKQDELINRINNLSDGKLTAVNEYLSSISDTQNNQLNITSEHLHNISNELLPLIKDEITEKMQSSLEKQDRIMSTCNALSESLNECKAITESISTHSSLYVKQIKELSAGDLQEFKKWLTKHEKSILKLNERIENISSIQAQLKEILNPTDDEGGGINGILIDVGAIKTSSISADSKLSALSSNNKELKNINEGIGEAKSTYSKISTEISNNNQKMETVCINIENFSKKYNKLLNELTAEQNRILAVQRENCELLRVIGDKFRGGK